MPDPLTASEWRSSLLPWNTDYCNFIYTGWEHSMCNSSAKPAASPSHWSYVSLKSKHQQGFTSQKMLIFASTTIQLQCPLKSTQQATTSDTRQTGTALKFVPCWSFTAGQTDSLPPTHWLQIESKQMRMAETLTLAYVLVFFQTLQFYLIQQQIITICCCKFM